MMSPDLHLYFPFSLTQAWSAVQIESLWQTWDLKSSVQNCLVMAKHTKRGTASGTNGSDWKLSSTWPEKLQTDQTSATHVTTIVGHMDLAAVECVLRVVTKTTVTCLSAMNVMQPTIKASSCWWYCTHLCSCSCCTSLGNFFLDVAAWSTEEGSHHASSSFVPTRQRSRSWFYFFSPCM